MRVLLLADIASGHTEKWARGLAQMGLEVGIFSFNKATFEWYKEIDNIKIVYQPNDAQVKHKYSNKLRYLNCFKIIKKKIKEFKPDIVHAHYASSYGYLGAYSKFHPFVVSAWGTDVMKFPYEGKIKNKLIKFSLNKADAICATSNTLDFYIKKLVNKPVHVIPFGIDMNLFSANMEFKSKNKFVFGAVKSLEKIYNIDVLIKAFAKLHAKHLQTELLLVGDGTESSNLKTLVKQLNIESAVTFAGRVPSAKTPECFNKLNCLVNVSQYESFGVSVIEAMACKVPVIVSATGGLMEIVTNEENGLYVNEVNENTTAAAMERILTDKVLTEKLILNGYKQVNENYNWQNNLKAQIEVYNKLLMK